MTRILIVGDIMSKLFFYFLFFILKSKIFKLKKIKYEQKVVVKLEMELQEQID
jgi:hypothetical protein